jgi:hypothetical protein
MVVTKIPTAKMLTLLLKYNKNNNIMTEKLLTSASSHRFASSYFHIKV